MVVAPPRGSLLSLARVGESGEPIHPSQIISIQHRMLKCLAVQDFRVLGWPYQAHIRSIDDAIILAHSAGTTPARSEWTWNDPTCGYSVMSRSAIGLRTPSGRGTRWGIVRMGKDQ